MSSTRVRTLCVSVIEREMGNPIPIPVSLVLTFRGGAVGYAAGAVEQLADRDDTTEPFVASGPDVGNVSGRSFAEPSAAAVAFLPKMTAHPVPDDVNWITR